MRLVGVGVVTRLLLSNVGPFFCRVNQSVTLVSYEVSCRHIDAMA